MRALHVVARVALAVLLQVVGIILVVASALPGDEVWHGFLGWLDVNRMLVLFAGVALVLLVWIFMLSGLRQPRRSRRDYLSFKTDGGTVSVSLEAAANFIRKLCDGVQGVQGVRPVVTARNSVLHVILNVKIKAGSQVPELAQSLQQLVRESLRVNLGLTELSEVHVSVEEVLGTPQSVHAADVDAMDGPA